ELLPEGLGEAPAAEVPAVELLQEPGRALLAELARGLADEEDELGHDLLAARLAGIAVQDLAQGPGISLRAAPDHHRGRARGRKHRPGLAGARDVAGGDDRDADGLHELGRERVVGEAGVHLPRRSRMERE